MQLKDFEIDENGVLTGYSGEGGDVVILDGVTSIGVGAFMGCDEVTIYTDFAKKPDGWAYSWNLNRSVVWGHKIK